MLYARESPNSTLCPLGQSNKAIGHESPIGPCVATHRVDNRLGLLCFRKTMGAVTTAKWNHKEEQLLFRFKPGAKAKPFAWGRPLSE